MLGSQKSFWNLQLQEEVIVWAPQREQKPFIQVETTRDLKSRCTMSYPLILNAKANYLSYLTHCHTAPLCVLVHHNRCSRLQYLPHKKRFMISKNQVNGKAIIQPLLFLHSCTSKQLSLWGFKNGKEKSRLVLFPKTALLNHSLCFHVLPFNVRNRVKLADKPWWFVSQRCS